MSDSRLDPIGPRACNPQLPVDDTAALVAELRSFQQKLGGPIWKHAVDVIERLRTELTAEMVKTHALMGDRDKLRAERAHLLAVARAADVFTNNPQCLGLSGAVELVRELAALPPALAKEVKGG